MSENELLTVHLRRTLSGWSDVPVTTDSVCHIAGLPIGVGGVARQRCAWCGEALAAAHRTDEARVDQAEFPAQDSEDLWQVGSFIRMTPDAREVVGIVWKDAIPSDACCAVRSERS